MAVSDIAPVGTVEADIYDSASGDEISPISLFAGLIRTRWKVLLGSALCLIVLALSIDLVVGNYFRTITIVRVENPASGRSPELGGGSLGGLGDALTGVGILSGLTGGSGALESALVKLQARDFIYAFIRHYHLQDELLERDTSHEMDLERVARFREEAYQEFLSRLVTSTDADSKTVALTLYWRKPERAAKMLNALVLFYNQFYAARDREHFGRNIRFLEAQLNSETQVDVRVSLSRILAGYIQSYSLAQDTVEYELIQIETAHTLYKRTIPRLIFLIPLAAFLGFVLGLLIIIAGFLWKRRNHKTAVIS